MTPQEWLTQMEAALVREQNLLADLRMVSSERRSTPLRDQEARVAATRNQIKGFKAALDIVGIEVSS